MCISRSPISVDEDISMCGQTTAFTQGNSSRTSFFLIMKNKVIHIHGSFCHKFGVDSLGHKPRRRLAGLGREQLHKKGLLFC